MYYPKNKIITDLYTNGQEFIFFESQLPYKGPYYSTYNGKYFSGKSPDDITSQELTPIRENKSAPPVSPYTPQSSYTSIPPNSPYQQYETKNLPYTIKTPPSSDDYNYGSFIRLFAKKSNEYKFYEIDKSQSKKLIARDPQWDWQYYIPFSITWILTGDLNSVISVNKSTVNRIQNELKLFGFNQYIEVNGGYNKFYKTK